MEQVKLDAPLTDVGLNGVQRAAAKALIIGRMARPGSERATHRWLMRQTPLGELIDEDFEVMGLAQLDRMPDRLEAIRTLFALECMTMPYDSTNTNFEGGSTANAGTKRARFRGKTQRLSPGHSGNCNQQIFMDRVADESGEDLRLYRYSAVRADKDVIREDREAKAFQDQLTAFVAGIENPGAAAEIECVRPRIGWLEQTHSQPARHDPITTDGSRRRHPGVCCLRTNLFDWDAGRLRRTYTMLRALEAVFRSPKTKLGLRPNNHQVPRSGHGRMFISGLAYRLAQIIGCHLVEHGIHDSWSILCDQRATQQRVTRRFTRKDGKTLYIRHASKAEPSQLRIYLAPGIDHSFDDRKKVVAK